MVKKALIELVTPAVVAALVAAIFCVGAAFGSAMGSHSLDSAQAAFEKNDEAARQYNWPVFKQANSIAKLHCTDTPDGSLRACVIRRPGFDPMTGERSNDIDEPFACTKTSCSWVKFR